MKRHTLFNPVLILSLILASVGSLIRPTAAFAADGGTWTTRASMPTARSYLSVVTVGTKLYAIGGYNPGSGSLSTVEDYDPATNTWMTRASMPTARYDFGAAVAANGKIYIIGGTTGSDYFATVEEYDPATNTWSARASMPTARYGLSVAAAANGKLYAIGGYNGSDLSIVEEYDPTTNTWAVRASMPTVRYDFGIAAANGKLYAIGGYNHTSGDLSTVEEYDPATDTWISRAGMPTARRGLGVAAANGKFYAIGGYNPSNGGALSAVEEYDPATNTWITRTSMPTARNGFGVALAANGKLYAIGGRNSSSYYSTVEAFTPPFTGINLSSVTDNLEIYPGDPVSMNLNIQNANGLYAAQAICSVDPSVLTPQDGTYGDFFDPVNRLVIPIIVDPVTGTWTAAISQRNPANPLSGGGLFATADFLAAEPGTTTITCDPLLSDRDGYSQPVSFTGATITVIPFANLSGVVTYQGRADHSGITITATCTDTRTAATNGTGHFDIDLKAGECTFEARAPGYLPVSTTRTVTSGQTITLPNITLRGGSVSGDDGIDIGDATLIAANFGLDVPPADARADINGDNKVNVQDLAILGGNYGLSGIQEWR